MTVKPGLSSTVMWWGVLGALILMSSFALRVIAPSFGDDLAIQDMPLLAFVASYVLIAAITAVAIPMLIRKTAIPKTPQVLILVVVVGAVARLSQWGAPTILEDDYNRYLWDGAVVASGTNPYEFSPLEVAQGQVSSARLMSVAQRGFGVLERVNYPQFRTVYPPIAQASFALSYAVAPFDLDGWRAVLFLFETGCLWFILAILTVFGRSPLWAALYWWNPLVIKEIANSAHMEPVVMLPVLAAGYLALQGRGIRASVALALAAGVKIWPVLMLAAVLRPYLKQPRNLIAALLLVSAMLVLIFWPVVTSNLNETSGFVAFARDWQASSAAFLVSNGIVAGLMPTADNLPFLTRMLLGLGLLAVMLGVSLRQVTDQRGVFKNMFVIAAALYLLSPTQTPWYFIWIAPFLCIFPVRGLILAGVLMPLHYLFFYLSAQDQSDIYRYGVVWMIWLPVWTLLLFDLFRTLTVKPAPAGPS